MFNRVVASVLIVMMMVGGVRAQDDRSLVWERWDVTIDRMDTAGNTFFVTENYRLRFNGLFRFGTAVIPGERLSSIDSVAVTQNGRPLTASCGGGPGSFCFTRAGTDYEIVYNFAAPISNGDAEFALSYRVTGALRVYEGGDQLWWTAIPEDKFGFSVQVATVTVELPTGFAPREGVDSVVTYGASSDVRVSGTRITATATQGVGANEGLEIRAQYPHDARAQAPSWQAQFDAQRDYEETVRPFVGIGLGLLSVLIALGGVLLVVARYQARGRDPKVGVVPEYLSEPPSPLQPAVVGSLIDEKADPRDVIATFVDLAERGYMVFEEDEKQGPFGVTNRSFTFKRTDKSPADLAPWEQALFNALFAGGRMERDLKSLSETFYTHIATAQAELYNVLVSEGLFDRNPDAVRTTYAMSGVLLGALSAAGVFLVLASDGQVDPLLAMIPIALAAPAVALLVASPLMPAKTRKGAEESAKWKAFYRYLARLDTQGASEAAARFDKLLPYAVAFGLDRGVVRAFESVPNVPAPMWYYPYFPGRRYMPGTPIGRGFGSQSAGTGMPGELARASGGGLDDLSGGLSRGLDSMSSGLTEMLNTASSAMTSRPQASSTGTSGSWRGGGGSWSGGGFSGGGSSGGGSRGFG